jgi:hypothetical protein
MSHPLSNAARLANTYTTSGLLKALHVQYLDCYADTLAELPATDVTTFSEWLSMEVMEAGL